jgi:ParB-like chromosome segregation protein Spo0J
MSEHRDTSLEDLALAIVAALPESAIDALAARMGQRRDDSVDVDHHRGDDEARARLLAYVAEHEPVSQRQARSAAGVAGRTTDAVIRDLERDGLIQNVGTGRTRAWVTCPKGPRPGNAPSVADTRDTRSDATVNGRGNRAEATITLEAAQTGTGHEFVGGECPDPSSCLHHGRHATGPWSCEHNHPRESTS